MHEMIEDLTNADSSVSFKSSKAAADVETLNVGAQSVGVAFVLLIILAFINVWILK